MTTPVWKPIGEASASFDANGLWIEQIDGFRVPVRRHFGMPTNADMFNPQEQDLRDRENHNRIRLDIVREALRMNEAQMNESGSRQLQERLARMEYEADADRVRAQQAMTLPFAE